LAHLDYDKVECSFPERLLVLAWEELGEGWAYPQMAESQIEMAKELPIVYPNIPRSAVTSSLHSGEIHANPIEEDSSQIRNLISQ